MYRWCYLLFIWTRGVVGCSAQFFRQFRQKLLLWLLLLYGWWNELVTGVECWNEFIMMKWLELMRSAPIETAEEVKQMEIWPPQPTPQTLTLTLTEIIEWGRHVGGQLRCVWLCRLAPDLAARVPPWLVQVKRHLRLRPRLVSSLTSRRFNRHNQLKCRSTTIRLNFVFYKDAAAVADAVARCRWSHRRCPVGPKIAHRSRLMQMSAAGGRSVFFVCRKRTC